MWYCTSDQSKFTDRAVTAEHPFLARPPLPATAGISGGLSASQLSLQLPMSFRKKLFTSFGCISDRNTSSLPTYTYYSILVTYTYPPFDFLPYLSQTFFGLKEFLITLWFWPIPFQPSLYHVSFLLTSEGFKESCKTGIWVNTAWRILSMMLWLSELRTSIYWKYPRRSFLFKFLL